MTASLEGVAPELRPALAAWHRFRLERPLSRWRLRLAAARAVPPPVEGVRVSAVAHGAARYRLYTPDMPSGGAVLWIHGGGYVSGSAVGDEVQCAEVARRLGAVVASVDYRLAPAHRYPAALDDCVGVWDDLQRRAGELGIDTHRVVLAGQSSGAGIAAALAQCLLDRRGVQPVGQWLSYAMLDDRTAADRSLDRGEHLVWDNRSNRFGWRAYLGRHDPTVGYAVPARRASLAGLPPAWIGVGDIDLFHAENVAYHERLVASGVDSTLVVVPGAPHAFDAIAPDTTIARSFRDAGLSWVAARVR